MTRQGSLPKVFAMAAAMVLAGACPTLGAEQSTAVNNAGAKGAQVYCFMRNRGNDHQVSWNAAYAVIKRQSYKLFKTSPAHAAVMITEAVVQNPDGFPECSRYLGDLFEQPEPQPSTTPPSTAKPTRS